MFNKTGIFSWALTILLVSHQSAATSQHKQKSVKPEPWSVILDAQNLSRLDQLGDHLSDVIFDAIDDVTLFKYNGNSFSANLSAHRRVFDNEDVLNSWTVVDRFEVAGNVPIYSNSLNSFGQSLPLTFSIGSQLGMQFIDIRRVTPSEFDRLPPVTARKEEIEGEPWFQEFNQRRPNNNSAENGKWVMAQNNSDKGSLTFIPRDPETEARYSKLSNLVVFPFHLPLKAEAVSRMGTGEIISYLGYGGVQMNAGIGWSLDPTTISQIAEGALSMTTYLKGTYRISVMKEDDKYVRVKTTRVGEVGATTSVGASAKPNFLDGVLILKNLQNQLRIMPFNFNVSSSISRSFDVGYRYNLTVPAAREAYEQAVIGRLSLSEELAKAKNGVEKIFTRDAITKLEANEAGLRIGFVFKAKNRSSIADIDAIVTLPDGTQHLLFANVENSKEWGIFWGSYEKLQNNFTVSLDLNKYATTGFNEALSLLIEGKIEDSDTFQGEMLEYELNAEDAVGKANIFPRIPNAKGNLGRSHFYYRVALSADQIEKFIQIPEEKMWGYLEKAFNITPGTWSNPVARTTYRVANSIFTLLNVPLYVAGLNLRSGSDLWHADFIRLRWINLSYVKDPKIRVEALGKMFFDKYYGYELAHLLRAVLDGEKISYYTTGYSPVFGRIVDQGGSTLTFEDISTKIQRAIDYDREGARPPDGDTSATVNEFTARQINSDQLELHLVLQKEPVAVYLQLAQANWWWPFHDGKKGDILVRNTGQFHAGENILILDHAHAGSPFYEIAKHLEIDNRYKIAIAVNNDNVHWGAIATARVRFQKWTDKMKNP